MSFIKNIKAWARRLKARVILLWLCCRQPDIARAPWLIGMLTVAYAISPIDLIPDFIPVLGFVDDAILLPLGITLAIRLIPGAIIDRCQPEAQRLAGKRLRLKRRWLMATLIVGVWLAVGILIYRQFC